MGNRFETALSSHDERSISVREKDLSTEVMGEMEFTAALYYLWTGDVPTAGERRLLDAVLSSLMVHGTTPSAIASRLTAMSEPDAVQAAIASGILGVGSQFIGTMKNCSEELQAVVKAEDGDAAITELVAEYQRDGTPFPGIGHPHLEPVDPRAERLFELADTEGVAGDHVDAVRDVREAFENATGEALPINATGAIAAVTSDLGMSPTAARGLAVISRATGVTGEVLEEQENPMAVDIWQYVDGNTEPPADG
ncbi:citryl-CoA lyase [Natronomonas marina]|uniref:citryl-CoA lyase n=1 Tax=Natronomonas marina TaxID=2961939 RepID=UPI0020C951AE|nr:citryl-CoA lyase [Natronomonas marina]